jgi:hypothetical protein
MATKGRPDISIASAGPMVGYPAGAGGGDANLSRSGGINSTFGTLGGGVPLTKGTTNQDAIGSGVNGIGATYSIRGGQGDNTRRPGKGGPEPGATPPQYTGGLQKPIQSLRTQRRAVYGGSQDMPRNAPGGPGG